MAVTNVIKIDSKVRTALWHYKIKHKNKSLSVAIEHALTRLKEFEAI